MAALLQSLGVVGAAGGVVQALATRGRALVRRGRLDPGFQLLVSAEANHPFGPPNDMLRTSIAAVRPKSNS